jgi:hypothetical protein
MGNILYSLSLIDENSVEDILLTKMEALERTNQELEERITELEDRTFRLELPEEQEPGKSGIDFKTIEKFVEKFMEKNPVDIGRVKPLQIPGLRNFEIDLMPPSVEKHLYSNIISLLLGFFDNEIQMDIANHRIQTTVSRFNS